jgi:methylmalonyl-CoA mutase
MHHGGDLAATVDEREESAAIWLDAGANALPMASLWLAHLDRRGAAWKDTDVHFGADPLGSLARDGRLPRDLMKLSSEMAALARYTAERMPGSSAISVSTQPYHEAGGGAAQELGLAAATLAEYLRWLSESGLEASAAVKQIGLRLSVGPDIFSEMAKVRAMRLLWTAVFGAYGVERPRAAKIHCVGSRRTLTRQEPELNVLRQAEQAFAGICGTADWVSAWGWDRAAGRSSSAARRLARNSLLILREEAAVARTSDPSAGSYLVEVLTRELAGEAWELAQEIEADGGMRAALLSGSVAARLAETAATREAAFEGGGRSITGVSEFALGGTIHPSIEEPARAYQEEAHSRLERHRREYVGEELDEVEFSRHFVVEDLVARSRQGATLAELGLRLGSVEGAESMKPLPRLRDAEPFEAIAPRGEEE